MNAKLMILCLYVFCVTCALLLNVGVAVSSDKAVQTEKYIKMIKSPSMKTRVDAAKMITRSGTMESKLYDVINEKLLDEYNLYPLNRDHSDEMSWMCKALASSGDERYAPTLEKIGQTASSTKLKKYAKESLSLISEYAERNKVMTEAVNNDPTLSPEINKYISMLRSDSSRLKKDAAKTIYRKNFKEKKLYDVLSEELLAGYMLTSSNGNDYADTMAWMCKALGASGLVEYKKTLQEVAEKSTSPKLRKYAKQSLGMLQ